MINSNLFFKEYKLSGDGSGFFDAYQKNEHWLNKSIELNIVHRTVTEDTSTYLKTLLENQKHYDNLWKEFVASTIISELKTEWQMEELTTDQVIGELILVDISFGFYDSPTDFSMYFRTKNVDSEHGVLLLCAKDGKPLKTYIE